MAAVKNTMSITELRNRTYLDNGQAGASSLAPWLNQRVTPTDFLGRIDTVGGTTYDWQSNGPAYHGCYFDPMYGTHVMWMWSTEASGFSDRNNRYNFHNLASWQYNIGPDFLQWGLNAFTNRCGYGWLDIDAVTGCEYISGHLGQSDHQYPAVSRDLTPGAGVFETDSGPPAVVSFLWPAIGITHSEKVHMAMMDYPARTSMYYSNITWPDWSTPIDFPPPAQEPGFPTQAVAASKVSNKVAIAWQSDNASSGGDLPYPAYYKLSEDDGENWADPVQLPFPPAFNPVPGESLGPSFHLSSMFPFFDAHDNLHVTASVFCAATESTLYYFPVEVWHWSEATGWTKVVRVNEDSMPGDGSAYGFNVMYAARPSVAVGSNNDLYAIWEQFNCWNSESQTLRWRAEIWGAMSPDNGATWGEPVRLTDPDETSKRFPFISPVLKGDSIVFSYVVDLVAGFVVQSEGPATNNPVCVQTVWTGDFPVPGAVAENPIRSPKNLNLAVAPNPFRNGTTVSYDVPKIGNVSLRVHDASGRVVRTLASGSRNPGSYNVTWDGRADNGSKLVPGIYFTTLSTNNSKLTRKLTLLQ